jgi:putative Ca2+/H+ antiporter (TMEM165/GDT1 family)
MRCIVNWRILGQTFASVFLAEPGDKTQLATLFLASGNSLRWTVSAGASLALVATSALAAE